MIRLFRCSAHDFLAIHAADIPDVEALLLLEQECGLHGCGCNVGQRFLGEERHVSRHQHVLERAQTVKVIVVDHVLSVVLKEQALLALDHVNAESPNLLRLEPLNHSLSVQQRSSSSVDDHDARLHFCNRFFADHVPSGWHQRHVHRDNVRGSPELVKFNIFANLGDFVILVRIVRNDVAAERVHNFRKNQTNAPGTTHTHGFAVQIEPKQAIKRKVAFPNSVVSLHNVPVQRLNQRDCVLCNCVRAVDGNSGDSDSTLGGSVQIHIVESSTAEQDQLAAVGGQLVDDFTITLIVHKDANCLEAVRQTTMR
mmetsp:Transcript_20804/g.48618  ORF Transcript_20804/g.48618 Transcript_20804/m.48618 type:complete len:311 (-) Transcript_20804:169-1101(-)